MDRLENSSGFIPGVTLEEAVVAALTVTMEFLAFEQPLLLDDDEEEIEVGSRYWATLSLLTPFEGKIFIWIDSVCMKNLLESIHGSHEDEGATDSDSLLYDTLSELINTVAGRFLSELIPPNVSFNLGLPESGKEDNSPDVPDKLASWKFSIYERIVEIGVAGKDFLNINENSQS